MKKPLPEFPQYERLIRPAKNFLAVLGRTTLQLGIRNQKNLVGRAMSKVRRLRDIKHKK